MRKILCLDFDGVLHSYASGWRGANIIPDPPVPGAMGFLRKAVNYFHVHVFSSRSHQDGGSEAMQAWLVRNLTLAHGEDIGVAIFREISFPEEKPPAFVTLDDRGILFTGTWPDLEELRNFKPWNKR